MAKHAGNGFYDPLRERVASGSVDVTLIATEVVRINLSINALRGDGLLCNRIELVLENGISPEDCVRRALDAIFALERSLLIGDGVFRRILILKRWSPAFVVLDDPAVQDG